MPYKALIFKCCFIHLKKVSIHQVVPVKERYSGGVYLYVVRDEIQDLVLLGTVILDSPDPARIPEMGSPATEPDHLVGQYEPTVNRELPIDLEHDITLEARDKIRPLESMWNRVLDLKYSLSNT